MADRNLVRDLEKLPPTNEVCAIKANAEVGYYRGREGDLETDLRALAFGDDEEAQEHLAHCISLAEHAKRGSFGKHQLLAGDAQSAPAGERTKATSPEGLTHGQGAGEGKSKDADKPK